MENTNNERIKYVVLEKGIAYDPDDYFIWGASYYEIDANVIKTCAYGHGTGLEFDGAACCVDTAIDNGIVSLDELTRALFECLGFGKGKEKEEALVDLDIVFHLRKFGEGLPVVVTRGRKLKGEACVISYRKTYDPYGREADTLVKVYSSEQNVFCETSRKNIQVKREVISKLSKYAFDAAFKHVSESVLNFKNAAHLLAYKMSYCRCDKEQYIYEIELLFARVNAKDYYPFTIKEGAYDPWDMARLKKRAARYKEKFEAKQKSLREWVETKLANETSEYREAKYRKVLNRWCEERGLCLSDFE